MPPAFFPLVMVFGTFDLFHPGHEFFIREAMKEGGRLVIVVARDSTVRRIKGVLRNPESFRQKVLQEAFPEAEVVLGDERDPMKMLRKYQPTLVCLGYDQVGFSQELRAEFPQLKVKRMGSYFPDRWKSSLVAGTSKSMKMLVSLSVALLS